MSIEISKHNIYFAYITSITALIWLGFVGILIWKFMKLDPYNTKVMMALIITLPALIIGLLYTSTQAIRNANIAKQEI